MKRSNAVQTDADSAPEAAIRELLPFRCRTPEYVAGFAHGRHDQFNGLPALGDRTW